MSGGAALSLGAYVVELECPQCHLGAASLVEIAARLTVVKGDSSLRATLKQKPAPHTCGQPELPAAEAEPPGVVQPELDWAERAAGGRDED